MKSRTRKPAAGTASSRQSQYPRSRVAHIRSQSRISGPAVMTSSTMLRKQLGARYCARIRIKSRAPSETGIKRGVFLFFKTSFVSAWPVGKARLGVIDEQRFCVPRLYLSLLQSGEQCGARLGDAAVGRGHSGECRPAALLDVGILHPRADLFKLGHVCRCLGGLAEFVSTHRGQNRHDGGSSTFCCGFLRSASQCPAAPTEADDHCCEKTGKRALQETRARLALQN